MRRTLTTAFTGLGALALLAGCSSQPAQPSPDKQTQSSAATPSSPSSDTVNNPLDTTNAEKEPCSIVPASQLEKFAINSTKPNNVDSVGPACNLQTSDIDFSEVTMILALHAGSYKNVQESHRMRFTNVNDNLRIAGYRAIDGSRHPKGRGGNCQTSVEVANSKYVTVSVGAGSDADPYDSHMCDKTHAVARIAVNNLKNGN